MRCSIRAISPLVCCIAAGAFPGLCPPAAGYKDSTRCRGSAYQEQGPHQLARIPRVEFGHSESRLATVQLGVLLSNSAARQPDWIFAGLHSRLPNTAWPRPRKLSKLFGTHNLLGTGKKGIFWFRNMFPKASAHFLVALHGGCEAGYTGNRFRVPQGRSASG